MEKAIMNGKYKRPSSKSSERVKLISILKDELRKRAFDLAKSLESSGSGYRILDDNKNTAGHLRYQYYGECHLKYR